MATTTYFLDIAERAAATGAQAAVAALSVGYAGVLDVDWVGVGSVAGLAAVFSVLKSIIAGGFGRGTASLVDGVGAGNG